MSFFHIHSHSEYSSLDGMPSVRDMVSTVASMGQPALGLTDHGNMSGSFALYKECKAQGILPMPGSELYVTRSLEKTPDRWHMGILALDLDGYKGIVELSSLSHQRDHYYYKPRVTIPELLDFGKRYGKHVVLTAGCYFGLIPQILMNTGARQADVVAKQFAKVFPHFYIEVQEHRTLHDEETGFTDADLTMRLYKMAYRLGLPVIATMDAHYCDHKDKHAHDMMKRLAYSGSGDNTDDLTFPGDSYHLSDEDWVKHHFESEGLEPVWDAVQSSYEDILDAHKLKIPVLDTYKFMVPGQSKFSDELLAKAVKRGMEDHGFDYQDHYIKRMKYELEVIRKTGFAEYFRIIARVTDYCRKNKILLEARGSANGSLVCYVLGITSVDPVEWKLSFDRFLSLDRKKPPDIDLDIDRDERQNVIDWFATQFTTLQIGTYGTLGEDQKTGRGSIFVKYLSWKKKQDPSFAASNFQELSELEPEDTKVLRSLSRMSVKTGYGTHAAGVLIGPEEYELFEYIPRMLVASSNSTVSQYTMDDVEDAGFVKGDFLGQASLTVIRRTLELIGKDPIDDGYSWIPANDPDALRLLRTGKPDTGIFQFEGYSTARGGKEMKVKSMKDAVLCLALYRPALMNGGHKDEYLYNRSHRDEIEYVSPLFESVLKETHGVFVFQEQVIEILRRLGMDPVDLNDMLKAVKASNDRIAWAQETFERINVIFTKLCREQGMSTSEAGIAWAQILNFSDYGFNRAHATGYGIRSYRTAYLKAHYALEYMTALLSVWAGQPKEREYIREARSMGVTMLAPHVNVSDVSWTIDHKRNGIRKGLLSVKGLGPGCAENIIANAPYISIEDLIERTDARQVTGGKTFVKDGKLIGKLKVLQEIGALDDLPDLGVKAKRRRKLPHHAGTLG